ncbi:hypothetical protein [Pseudactinotalea terrae]|uniref:hypothetical protein n=1 Tax=Pseudactinotalea terrae TaxID=1743262 RepID=UPI0012E247BC|nr:hypothetical protein [Pseudactinotalea terrae]
MEWTADVAAGAWLAERIDSPWRRTMHDLVPRGFDAYARVFHPVSRDRPVGRAWPPLPYAAHRAEWEAFQASRPEIDREQISWARTAAAFGTAMHPLAQWDALVAPGVIVENEDGPRDRDGWRYDEPEIGQLEPALLATVALHLAQHTSTPDGGHLAVWEGWGGLVGAMAPLPSRAFLTSSDEARHRGLLSHLVPERFRSPFAKDRWQPGILPDEVSAGPRLQLPGRDHVLFTGGVSELTSPDWVLAAPWRDREAEGHGIEPSAHSPSLVWPEDHAWVLVSEVDWDSTIVAGTVALIEEICADPALEALPLPPEADLTVEGDRVNDSR